MRKIDVLHQLQDFDSRIDGARAAVARLETEIADAGTIAQLAAEVQRSKDELQQLETQQQPSQSQRSGLDIPGRASLAEMDSILILIYIDICQYRTVVFAA